MRKIGIFGGTFDPPHVGHLILAEEALFQFKLNQLLWVLTPDPPHKLGRPVTRPPYRLAMVELAIAGNDHFSLSTIDLDRPRPQFAIDTVRLLSNQNPGDQMVYVMGSDSMRDLPTWHNPKGFVDACHEIGVMHRLGDQPDLQTLERMIPGLSRKVRFLDTPLIDISAAAIRSRVLSGQPFRYYLPASVYSYIMKHDLYRKKS